ncbi:hypothetical protein [Parapedobacter sp. 2B3]|uniref:hypothetical protein n=1 Tax=Parapedobacter sp. 2B3 TaxID=3342381 RepID=UPI0035B60502
MEKTITHHPLRTIELRYHPDRPQPEWEKETLAKYIHLHDEVWRLKNMREEYEYRLDKAIAHTNEIIYAISPYRQRLHLLQAVAGIIESVHARPLDNSGVFHIDMDDFRTNKERIADDMAALGSEMSRCKEEYNAFINTSEEFDAWFEAFAEGQLHEIYQRYDEASVDTVSLDRDHQNLLEEWQPITFAERLYNDKALSAFFDYTEIVEITDDFSQDVDVMENRLYKRHPEIEKSGIINIRLGDDGEYHPF